LDGEVERLVLRSGRVEEVTGVQDQVGCLDLDQRQEPLERSSVVGLTRVTTEPSP
jgi:hypothetical protein